MSELHALSHPAGRSVALDRGGRGLSAEDEKPARRPTPMQSPAQDSVLMSTRRELFETSIAQLQTLAAFIRDQLGESADRSAAFETCACEEILRAVNALLETHNAALSVAWSYR